MSNQTYEIPNKFWDLMKKIPSHKMTEKSTLFPVTKEYFSGGADVVTCRYFEIKNSDFFKEIATQLNYKVVEKKSSLYDSRSFWHCAERTENRGVFFEYHLPDGGSNYPVGTVVINEESKISIVMSMENELRGKMLEEVLFAHFLVFLDSFKS